MSKKNGQSKLTHIETANGDRVNINGKAKISKDIETIENGKQKVKLDNKHKSQIIMGKRLMIKCKNKKQKDFLKTIKNNEITLCKGPAGVGKSYLSVIQALHLLQKPDNFYEKLFIVTPIVESEEKIGYLKGSLEEKMSPYLYSTYYLIDKIIGEDQRKMLVEKGIIVPLALAYMRGINIDNGILIFEEAQNASKGQFKTLLTRIGFNTKFIISGDVEQIDRYKKRVDSGLYDAFDRFQGIEKMGFFEFTQEDVVRNPIISQIIKRYENE